MLSKIFVACICMAAFLTTTAQDIAVTNNQTTLTETKTEPEDEKKPALTISGSADAYYRYDFGKTKYNNLTSFTNTHNNFALGMASVKFEHASEKVNVVADLGFGDRAREFTYTDDGITGAIKQLYISYAPAEWIKFTAGSWATHVGYELLDPQLNRNYSMSYMFTNGPFSHTGLKTEISKGKHGIIIGIANPTDYRLVPEGSINKKFFLAQYSYAASDNVNIYINYVGGKSPDSSKSEQIDVVVTSKFSDQFSIGYNGTIINMHSWDGAKNMEGKSLFGSALYLNYDPKSWFGLTLRGEYFDDKNHFKTFSGFGNGGNVFSTTLSANFKKGNFILIPEIRVDKASEKIFTNADGAGSLSAGNFLVAAIYSF